MKICLINGNPGVENSGFEDSYNQLVKILVNNHEVTSYVLREKKIKSCTGCFSCWVKTPGECIFSDDTADIRKKTIHSDLVLFASPIIMGFTSALLKHVQDKMIPLLHPYILFVDKECHHEKRYENYPKTGVLYQKMEDTTQEELHIIEEIYNRYVINFHSDLILFENIQNSPEEIAHALNIA